MLKKTSLFTFLLLSFVHLTSEAKFSMIKKIDEGKSINYKRFSAPCSAKSFNDLRDYYEGTSTSDRDGYVSYSLLNGVSVGNRMNPRTKYILGTSNDNHFDRQCLVDVDLAEISDLARLEENLLNKMAKADDLKSFMNKHDLDLATLKEELRSELRQIIRQEIKKALDAKE